MTPIAKEIGTILYVEPGPNIWGASAPHEMAFELYPCAFCPDQRRVPETDNNAIEVYA